MALAPPLSSREVRRAASHAVQSANQNSAELLSLRQDIVTMVALLKQHQDVLTPLPKPASTIYDRLRWVLRGE
jgi:hypothetical protein